MRVAALLRTRSFRLALIYVLLFGISIVLLLGFIYLLAGNRVKSHVDEFVTSEMELLVADYDVDGPAGVIGLMQSRNNSDRSGHWLYLYRDAAGGYLAGDRAVWPAAEPEPDGFINLPAAAGNIRAREAHFPDGSRLLVGLNDYEVTEVRAALGRAMLAGLGVILLLALIGGVLATLASLRQLEPFNRVTREIMGGDLQRRVPVSQGGDEFDQLGRNINAMLDRIGELMQAVQSVTDNIAHDLRMPLTRLRQRLDAVLGEDLDRNALQSGIEAAIGELDSILQTFGALLRITHIESGSLRQSFADVDLSRLVTDAEQLFEPMAAETGHRLTSALSPGISIAGNRDLLFQALSNLIDNAIKHTPDGTDITLGLARIGNAVEITVADNGPGVPEAERQAVFRRMYRVDRARSTPGSGLGLALVHAVATLHDGHCEITDNRPGARVALVLHG